MQNSNLIKAGFKVGYLNRLEKMGTLRPRTLHSLIGAGAGAIPAALVGGLTAEKGESPALKAFQYGGLGALGGAGLGYAAPLGVANILRQLAPTDIEKQLQNPGVQEAIAGTGRRGTFLDKILKGYIDLFGKLPENLDWGKLEDVTGKLTK